MTINILFRPTVVAQAASESRPGLTHNICMGRDGVLYCTCESWRYQRLPASERSCKHLRAFAQRAAMPLATVKVAAPPKTPKVRKPNPWTAPLPSR